MPETQSPQEADSGEVLGERTKEKTSGMEVIWDSATVLGWSSSPPRSGLYYEQTFEITQPQSLHKSGNVTPFAKCRL